MLLSHNKLVELVLKRMILSKPAGPVGRDPIDFDQINSASIDIKLGKFILCEVAPEPENQVLDFRRRDKLSVARVEMDPELGFILGPGQFVLAESQEIFNLPHWLSCEYKLKSSMARIGLEHLNAGWCFVGETQVPLLDGSTVPIASLVGKEAWVYSLDAQGEVVPGHVSRVWETKTVQTTVVVTLDNGDSFECTPDHRIMLRGGGYCEAQHLTEGTSLMPLYRKTGQNGHEMVYSPSTVLKGKWKQPKGRWHKTHVLIDHATNGPLPHGQVVHHDNHNKADNSPGNLLRMSGAEHIALHNGIRNRSVEQRAIASATMSRANSILWQDPEYAAKKAVDAARNAAHVNNKRWGTPIPAEFKNHTVVSVRRRRHRIPIPVYDMTVDSYHNFAIGAGVFVHNCDAGWNGSVLTLELKNLTEFHSVLIRPGDAIGQMVFFEHEEVPHSRSYAARGRYNNDVTVQTIKE